ncbi:MAG: DNA polymerase III subunit beta [Spirochaetia bacterium]|nr:DNA polymerase III subunit beta [Spirochaetia bacterium]
MKFRVSKDSIEKSMSRIEAIVPARDMQTLLSNVLLTLDKNKLSITASDMESTVKISMDAAESENGQLIVRAKKLSEIAKQLNSDELVFNAKTVEKDENDDSSETYYNIQIEGTGTKAAKFRMTGGDRSHFPDLNKIEDNKLSSIPTNIISEMLQKTMYSISHEDNRYIYNGIYFSANGSKLTLVGTDGRRLAAVQRDVPNPVNLAGDSEEEYDIVVHAKAVRELQRILDADDTMNIGIEQRDIFFRVGDAELSSRLLEGKFPDYKKVIPETAEIKFSIERKIILDALQQIMVMTEPPSHQVKLFLTNDNLEISANTPDVGEAEISIPVEYKGEELEIGFNALYLTDILKNLNCEKINVELNDSSKPIVIKDNDDPGFVSLVMPMKI